MRMPPAIETVILSEPLFLLVIGLVFTAGFVAGFAFAVGWLERRASRL